MQQMSWPALTCIVIQFPLPALLILQARIQDVLVKVTNQDVTVFSEPSSKAVSRMLRG